MKLNNIVLCIFDSTRFDSMAAARTPFIDLLGRKQRRFSFASWTGPSHASILMGQLPHASPRRVFASELYRQDLLLWRVRTGDPGMSFEHFLPELSLPRALQKMGYRTHAMVSLPALNPQTIFRSHFDSYQMMSRHNDFMGMIKHLRFSRTRPQFYLLNIGETHYPYQIPTPSGVGGQNSPPLPGLHGVLKRLGRSPQSSSFRETKFFTQKQMQQFHRQQIRCVEYLDSCLKSLYEKCPRDTYLIVTSDHGELFGEGGYFGHGPVMHRKVFEVPLIEGLIPSNF